MWSFTFRFTDVKQKVFEAHILHKYIEDFYDSDVLVGLCGYLRDEKKFNSLDELITAIQTDCRETEELLAREGLSASIKEQLLSSA